jgi:hypothetical protein
MTCSTCRHWRPTHWEECFKMEVGYGMMRENGINYRKGKCVVTANHYPYEHETCQHHQTTINIEPKQGELFG